MSEDPLIPKFDAAPLLQRTPEQIRDDEEAQQAAAERLSHLVSDSVAFAQYKTNVGQEKGLRASLERIALSQNNARFAEDDEEWEKLQERAEEILAMLAECFFWQGKFYEASVRHPVEAQRKEYADFGLAFGNLDAPVCECPPMRFASKGSAKGVSVPSRREIQSVFVGELEREVKFVRCEKCRKLFAQSA